MIKGIPKSVETKLIKVFAQFPSVETVRLYGSRAKNQYRKGSDIDLVLTGPKLNFQTLLKIYSKIDDLLLPYKVDLSLYDFIKNSFLKSEIQKWGKIIYQN